MPGMIPLPISSVCVPITGSKLSFSTCLLLAEAPRRTAASCIDVWGTLMALTGELDTRLVTWAVAEVW